MFDNLTSFRVWITSFQCWRSGNSHSSNSYCKLAIFSTFLKSLSGSNQNAFERLHPASELTWGCFIYPPPPPCDMLKLSSNYVWQYSGSRASDFKRHFTVGRSSGEMMPTYRPSAHARRHACTHALSHNIHTYARQKHKLIEMLFGVTTMMTIKSAH